MFEISVGDTKCELTQADYKTLAQLSEGYSGSDIAIAVQDALMQPVRKIQTATHYKKVRLKVICPVYHDKGRTITPYYQVADPCALIYRSWSMAKKN
jgi:SpoVK/Ycf46/Vps4 family AAA+-type ATPase